MKIYRSDSLIRRYLSFSKAHNSSDKLPALTSSALVDVELYSIIAIICRDYINIWYEQMTHDKSFVEELLFLVSHVVKELEKRFFMIKHETLFLQNIRKAQKIVQADINSHMTFDEIFHGFQQHPALDSQENEHLYLRLAVDGLITSLLPSNDLKSECERVMIREILSDFILKKTIDKLSEPSFLFEIIAKLIVNLKEKTINKTTENIFFSKFILIKMYNLIIFLWKTLFIFISNPLEFPTLNIFDSACLEFIFEILEFKTEIPHIYIIIRFFLIPCVFVFVGGLISNYFMKFWCQRILTEQFAVSCFRALRIAIWPNNIVEIPKIQHCKIDNNKIKEYLETEMYTGIPVFLRKYLFGSNDEIVKIKIKRICSLFESKKYSI
ncbi:hypothetical protein PCK1_002847 [Pneumocystis canis]|nr:hypothetical protein PCK1_002847 [Pneumocystis canis]